MRRLTQLLLMLLLTGMASQRLAAFSLLGPSTVWQTVRLGYDLAGMPEPTGGQGWNGGGPMNLAEQYRINYPTLTWGCSPTFLNYFGQRGLQEIEKAVAILNALPSVDAININDYPLTAIRENYKAATLGIYDLKSVALSVLINHMGLADPTRYVFTLRQRIVQSPAPTNYFVIKRNFDPDTWDYSSYINGQLWTYDPVTDVTPSDSLAATQPVDPLAFGGIINAPVSGGWEGNGWLFLGSYWTGLTRDDVGGLKYIYRHNNYALETALTNATQAGSGAVVTGGGNTSPWTVPNFGTNTTTGTTGTTGTTIPGQNTNVVSLALRPGIGKVQWVHMIEESQIGSFVTNTVAWSDTFLTNGLVQTQNLTRSATVPDVLFDAGDLQGGDSATVPLFVAYQTVNLPWQSSGNGTTTYGPGVIPAAVNGGPGLTFTFQTVGPTYFNGPWPNFLNEVGASRFFLWGSYDGSSADPIVYPDQSSILAIEAQVLGGGAGGTTGGGTPASQVGIWTPAATILLPVSLATGGTTGTGTGTGTGGGGTGGTGG